MTPCSAARRASRTTTPRSRTAAFSRQSTTSVSPTCSCSSRAGGCFTRRSSIRAERAAALARRRRGRSPRDGHGVRILRAGAARRDARRAAQRAQRLQRACPSATHRGCCLSARCASALAQRGSNTRAAYDQSNFFAPSGERHMWRPSWPLGRRHLCSSEPSSEASHRSSIISARSVVPPDDDDGSTSTSPMRTRCIGAIVVPAGAGCKRRRHGAAAARRGTANRGSPLRAPRVRYGSTVKP